MTQVSELKGILKTDAQKRIGTVSDVSSGSVIVTDLLGRKFRASVPSELTIIVGNNVLVTGDVVVGKTAIENEPVTFVV